MRRLALLLGVAALSGLISCTTPSQLEPPKQYVYFVEPSDGATVTNPFKVKFGLVGMELKAAGAIVANSGHHHLIIDDSAIPEGDIVPYDERHLHFGTAQTETELKLAPGNHKLTLQFANGAHLSFGPAMSKTISVTVRQP